MAHANEEIAKKATQALQKGDMEGFMKLHNDDVIVHFPGRGPLAGDYKGKGEFAQLFQKQMEMLDRPPEIETHDILANDRHTVVLNNTRGTRKGQTLDLQQVVVMHIDGGKISEVWLQFSDQYAMDEMAKT